MKGLVFLFSVLLVFVSFTTLFANSTPVVRNVTASQRTDGSKKVYIRYDLSDADGDTCTVSVQVSDDHDGLKAAVNAQMPAVLWQRCQTHLQRNAMAYVPKVSMRKAVHNDIRDIFNAPSRDQAEQQLKFYIQKYEKSVPKLSEWMEENLPEGLTVFALPAEHRRRMRTTNMLERVHEEINRRTPVAGLFPNEASLLRLASAILMELSEEWKTGKRYLNMDVENADPASNQKQMYRKKGCVIVQI